LCLDHARRRGSARTHAKELVTLPSGRGRQPG
jgi:hypothetical protein